MPRTYKPKKKDIPDKFQAGFIARMDGRQELTKRLQAAYDAIVDDLGGPDDQTHLRLALVERAVFLECQIQKWEMGILMGTIKDDAIGRWIQAVNSLLGLAKTLGLSRTRIQGVLDALYNTPDDPDDPDQPQSPTKPRGLARVGASGSDRSPRPDTTEIPPHATTRDDNP